VRPPWTRASSRWHEYGRPTTPVTAGRWPRASGGLKALTGLVVRPSLATKRVRRRGAGCSSTHQSSRSQSLVSHKLSDTPLHLLRLYSWEARIRAWSSLVSNKKFPIGLPHAEPPHLDVVAEAPSGLLAIESKCTEYLSPKVVKFSERYETGIRDERASGKWFAEMRRLEAIEGAGYSLLDAAQLIKHALGLARGRNNTMVNLVYVYWEPIDASLLPLFTRTTPKSLSLLSGSLATIRPSNR
jgi:hypothetical protein